MANPTQQNYQKNNQQPTEAAGKPSFDAGKDKSKQQQPGIKKEDDKKDMSSKSGKDGGSCGC